MDRPEWPSPAFSSYNISSVARSGTIIEIASDKAVPSAMPRFCNRCSLKVSPQSRLQGICRRRGGLINGVEITTPAAQFIGSALNVIDWRDHKTLGQLKLDVRPPRR